MSRYLYIDSGADDVSLADTDSSAYVRFFPFLGPSYPMTLRWGGSLTASPSLRVRDRVSVYIDMMYRDHVSICTAYPKTGMEAQFFSGWGTGVARTRGRPRSVREPRYVKSPVRSLPPIAHDAMYTTLMHRISRPFVS